MTKDAKIKELLLHHLKINLDEVPAATQIRDLGLDSLDFMEVLMDVEEELGITFTNEELLSIKTVSDLLKVIDNKI